MELPCQARVSLAGEEGETQLRGAFHFSSASANMSSCPAAFHTVIWNEQRNLPGNKGAHELQGLPSARVPPAHMTVRRAAPLLHFRN